jgi:hypothetical protein
MELTKGEKTSSEVRKKSSGWMISLGNTYIVMGKY